MHVEFAFVKCLTIEKTTLSHFLKNCRRVVNLRRRHSSLPLIHFSKLIAMKDLYHIQQVAFQSNANHPLAESMGYIKFEGM